MDPKQLVRALLQARGETPNSVVKLTRPRMTQSTLQRFLVGNTGEPRRQSMQPLADFLEVPVEAFYDAQVADRVARQLGLRDTATLRPAASGAALHAAEPAAAWLEGAAPHAVLENLATMLRKLPAPARVPIGALLDRWAQAGGAPAYQAAIEALLTKDREAGLS